LGLTVGATRADVSLVMGKPTVLVVDDDPLLCELLRATFELEGIEMREAGHVIEAEKIIAAELPDAIVLDVGLPGVDGLFYCERLREAPRTRTVPIVVISGSREAGVSALTVGAQGFFAKPFDPLQLLSMLERLLGIDPFHRVTREPNVEPAAIGDLRRLLAIGQRQQRPIACCLPCRFKFNAAHRHELASAGSFIQARSCSRSMPTSTT